METIYLSLCAQVAVGTFFKKSPVFNIEKAKGQKKCPPLPLECWLRPNVRIWPFTVETRLTARIRMSYYKNEWLSR